MPRTAKQNNRLGESLVMSNGMRCTIIEYKDCNHITVQFEDGVIVPKRQYNAFKSGNIHHPGMLQNSNKADERIGAERMMNCGHTCRIISYKNGKDIEVEFDTGAIVRSSYDSFINGEILCPGAKIIRKRKAL